MSSITCIGHLATVSNASSAETSKPSIGFVNPRLILTNKNIALPIRLISFNASLNNNNVSLNWSCSLRGKQLDYFTIERSKMVKILQALFNQNNGTGDSTFERD
ncbi:MAG: hypothetical protein IPL24_13615 [Bacteroidetes bacterium]|nr:hypothetical protein [Bacteroidota bacterium]